MQYSQPPMLDHARIKAITLDLDDTLWPIWPTIARAETVLADWLQHHAPATATLFSRPGALREIRNQMTSGALVSTADRYSPVGVDAVQARVPGSDPHREQRQVQLELPVGVGARRSATKSAIVTSVSWPTPDTNGNWEKFRYVLTDDDRAVWDWLSGLRAEVPAVPAMVSELRLLDVLLWMSVEAPLPEPLTR